ncbi:patatin-like phospholipase family protein [Pseudonocardia humida]|uniref:Patatin-like phospholipase family protein n=1 Tax=Pseudonocardia humida TaxID=2800819 RepID=A0ABT1A8F9_9PSEU|nr:patatin-like phospholipase family protein [Pseudonocardia humida]MCO1659302.1 patatin-like phospholipase family protein [Pseudonocardia humida]
MGTGGTAFVLGGGGVLGAVQIGMLRALVEAGIRPDLVVGTSVGALNGAVLAALPAAEVADRLELAWRSPGARELFAGGGVARLRHFASSGVAAHSPAPLRRMIGEIVGERRIEDLPVPFTCCAARIEDAAEHWFDRGPVVDAVLASAAVPGLLPPAEIDGRHYLDGGLVNSIPLGRAVELGARRVFVLQVGRVDQPLRPPRRPWEVAMVAFEIARRHRYARDLAAVPPDVEVHVLPTGGGTPRWDSRAALRYRATGATGHRVAAAYQASAKYLGIYSDDGSRA